MSEWISVETGLARGLVRYGSGGSALGGHSAGISSLGWLLICQGRATTGNTLEPNVLHATTVTNLLLSGTALRVQRY